ncbi:MAG: fibronectin type III domain-containing protein [Terriglobales bacterium]
MISVGFAVHIQPSAVPLLPLILFSFRMRVHPGKIFAAAAFCILLSSCAQTGPPLPPSLELPKPPGDLRASRKGDRVTLTWDEPTLTTDRQTVRYIGPTLICRSVEIDITQCGNPAAMLPAPPASPKKATSPHRKEPKSTSDKPVLQTYTDTLPANMLRPDPAAEFTYAVEVLNRNARGAGLSNRVHVPAVVTLPPPRNLSASLNGDGVELTWTSGGEAQKLFAELSGHSPGLQVRYRVYRREENTGAKNTGKDAIAGEVGLSEHAVFHFVDSSFEWEKIYLYRVTAVTVIKRADSELQVEGDDSAPVRVVAHDVFPPSVPTGLQAAYSGEGQKPFIDVIWAPVTNADLAGYNVYRSGGEGQKVVKVNSELVKSSAYRDSAVESGKTYTYSVSAVDARGNESARSEETSEAVP